MFLRFLLNIKTTFYRLYEWVRVVFKYYLREPLFLQADLLLLSQYLLRTPHQISKAYLVKRGEANPYQFGETPLTTLDKIARRCQILSHDHVYELGSGSGRTCFWLHSFIKCSVTGIEQVPTFIKKANWVRNISCRMQPRFLLEDMFSVDLTDATVIYLYGTCLEDEIIHKLTQHLTRLKPKTKVISVSYPLTDYSDSLFKLVDCFPARFPWGKAEVFLNIRL